MTVRRSHDRRRRVLYSGGIETASPTAADRRRTAELRQARRPAAMYGQRVQRRLQARWYSLVPVRNRTYATTSAVLLGIAAILMGLHAASVQIDFLRDHTTLSNPLRLDRADSLGRFLQTTLFLYGAGISLLIYQLRRYRLDDYQGTYRLWRTVLVMMLVASINSACGLIDWSGAVIDVAIGRRLALSGADWVRMIATMSLMILAARVLVEVRHNRVACGALVVAGLAFLIPESVRWNLSSIDDLTRWTLITSAPLFATACLVVGLNGCLRTLYREVQEIDDGPSLRQRIGQIGWSIVPRRETETGSEDEILDDSADESEFDDDDHAARPRRRWFGLRAAKQESVDEETTDESDQEVPDAEPEPSAASTKPRGLRNRLKARQKASAPDPIETTTNEQDSSEADAEDDEPAAKRPGLWSRLKRKPRPPAETDSEETEDTDQPDAASPTLSRQSDDSESMDSDSAADEPPTKRKGLGLGRFLKKRVAADAGESDQNPDDETTSEPSPTADSWDSAASANANERQNAADDDEYVDPESIDWGSLSKSERRRLKKVIKRQGRAA